MKIKLSKPSRDYFNIKYPHITDGDIEYLMFCGSIEAEEVIERIKFGVVTHMNTYKLIIPYDIAKDFDVDEEIDIFPDENGVFYKVYIENNMDM